MIVLYNLPPYLLTKRFFISLSMIIPGPTSPSENTIDVFLQPLVHELNKLWRGVLSTDMSEPDGPNRRFKMRGMFMWSKWERVCRLSGMRGGDFCRAFERGLQDSFFRPSEVAQTEPPLEDSACRVQWATKSRSTTCSTIRSNSEIARSMEGVLPPTWGASKFATWPCKKNGCKTSKHFVSTTVLAGESILYLMFFCL